MFVIIFGTLFTFSVSSLTISVVHVDIHVCEMEAGHLQVWISACGIVFCVDQGTYCILHMAMSLK